MNANNNSSYRFYPLRAIKPMGWLLGQIRQEMTTGLVAYYDKIDPTVAQNLFAENKRDHGFHPTYHKIPFAPDWWSGEHEGYWKDAFVRLAFYSGMEGPIRRAKEMMQAVLKSAEQDGGYIGMYSKKSRYNQERGKDNGELWAQSRILQALMAYHQFTQEDKVLDAITKAADITIENYSNYGNYFDIGKGGGIGHGLMLAEPLEELYYLTGDGKYADFIRVMQFIRRNISEFWHF